MKESPDRHITLAIHTYNYALELKQLLETEGISVTLQNVNLTNPGVGAGVRIRIPESQLPQALRIVENPDIFSTKSAGNSRRQRTIIVPVDFSPHSLRALDIAFSVSFAQNASIVMLHTYGNNEFRNKVQLSDSLTYDTASTAGRKSAQLKLDNLSKELKQRIKNNDLPPVNFTSLIEEGIPEDSIARHAKEIHPVAIIMGTRGAGAKEREVVGSVTAEVLDSARFPVITVPDIILRPSEEALHPRRITMFVNFEQDDFIVLDQLHSFLPPRPNININFVYLGNKFQAVTPSLIHGLLEYAERHYPECHFTVDYTTPTGMLAQLSSEKTHPELIVVPNKRRTVFARLFNPGVAHRLLFHADIPMMVIPV